MKKILSLVALCGFLAVCVGCNETKPTTSGGAKPPTTAPTGTDKPKDK